MNATKSTALFPCHLRAKLKSQLYVWEPDCKHNFENEDSLWENRKFSIMQPAVSTARRVM